MCLKRFTCSSVLLVLSFIICSIYCLRFCMYLPSFTLCCCFLFHVLLVFSFVACPSSSVNDVFCMSRSMHALDCPFRVFSAGQMLRIFVACCSICLFSFHHVFCLYSVLHCWNFGSYICIRFGFPESWSFIYLLSVPVNIQSSTACRIWISGPL